MASNTAFLDVSELDVLSLTENLKTFMKNQDIFKDYNFDASNLSQLINVLTYNTHLNGYYLNVQGSEAFLDSATLKENAVSRAKELNYVPRSRVSSQAIIQLNITTANSNVSTITVPKGYYFSTTGADRNYLFSTNEALVLRNEGGSFTANVNIYEGRWVTEYFLANANSFILSSANVDVSSIYVTVQNSQADTTTRIFNRAYTLFGLNETSLVYFLEGYSADNYKIIFGNDTTGVALDSENIVIVQYRETSGTTGNGFSRFTPAAQIVDADGNIFNAISAVTIQNAAGGAERETIDSIKFNAPRHFSAQDRAVTKNDFTVMVKENFPQIQAISVFGGEELTYKKYGRVVIATKPFGSEVTPLSLKNDIGAFLADRMTLTMAPIFADPDYYYVEIKSAVSFDPSVTKKTTSDIETLVRNTIDSYKNNYLFDFNADFRYSKLISMIDASDSSIISDDTSVRMIKRLTPIEGFSYSATVNFANPLFKEATAFARPIGNQPVIESDFFTYLHTDGVIYNAKLHDNGLGSLQVLTADLGLLFDGIGTVDYDTGIVIINGLIVQSFNGHINLYAKLAAKDIIIGTNQIINIDQADVQITVVKALF